MDTERERKWREEREKVLEEWSEDAQKMTLETRKVQIELRFREGTPVRIAVSRESLDVDDAISLQPTILSEPTSWCEEKTPEDPLISKLFSSDYDHEKTLVKTSLPLQVSSMNSFMRRCICRPAEKLNSEELIEERILLLAMTKKPYTSTTAFHWPMLSTFYRITASHCLDDPSLANECPAIGSHWQIVGFQGTNPMTDFRGVGVFGLLQLYCYAMTSPEQSLREIVQLSRSEPNDFPFAVVGLNFSAMLVERMKSDDLNRFANVNGNFLFVVNKLFRSCMEKFTKIWRERNCTITDTQTVLTEINGILRSDPGKLMKMTI